MIKTLYPIFQHWSEKGSVYILSDLHFDDEDCKLMNHGWITPEEQVAIINKMVHKNDTFICLGDVGNAKYIKEIKGYKVLIMGNHDAGITNFERKITKVVYDQDKFSFEEVLKDMKNQFPDCKIWIEEEYSFHSPFMRWVAYADNCLFDEVFEGPLMIGEKILLSHEPIYGLPWCLNIHGHDHNGKELYREDCKHINLAANVCNFTPLNLGKLIKDGALSDVRSIHRMTIDNATERKEKLGEKRYE